VKVCNCVSVNREIPSSRSVLLKINTNACQGSETQVSYLEHVQAVITLNATRRGDVELFLTSPMGTRSVLVTVIEQS
jgi:proprotein convertase subtilisin/kexin type 2